MIYAPPSVSILTKPYFSHNAIHVSQCSIFGLLRLVSAIHVFRSLVDTSLRAIAGNESIGSGVALGFGFSTGAS